MEWSLEGDCEDACDVAWEVPRDDDDAPPAVWWWWGENTDDDFLPDVNNSLT